MKNISEILESIFDDQDENVLATEFIKRFNDGECGNKFSQFHAISLKNRVLTVELREMFHNQTIEFSYELVDLVDKIKTNMMVINNKTVQKISIESDRLIITAPPTSDLESKYITIERKILQDNKLSVKNCSSVFITNNDNLKLTSKYSSLSGLMKQIRNINTDVPCVVRARAYDFIGDYNCKDIRQICQSKKRVVGGTVINDIPNLSIPGIKTIPSNIHIIQFESKEIGSYSDEKYKFILTRKPRNIKLDFGQVYWSKPMKNGWYLTCGIED